MQRVGNVEPLQQDRGVAFGGIAIFLADNPLELAETHTLFVGHVGPGVKRVAFGKRVPEATVSHHDGIDDAVLVEGEVILAQHAQLRRTDDRPTLRVELARQQLHECGFAGAVRAREPVSPAGGKDGRHVLEEHLRPVPHGDAAD